MSHAMFLLLSSPAFAAPAAMDGSFGSGSGAGDGEWVLPAAAPLIEGKVTGGGKAAVGAWPDAAAIYFGNEVECTGVLIAPEVVLTAGHCAEGITAVKLNTTDFAKGGERIAVDRVVAYPKWGRTYDLALVFLSEASAVAPRMIAQDCVLDEALSTGAAVAVVGYGATDVWGEEYGSSLQEGVTEIVDPDCTDLSSGCNTAVSPAGEVGAGGNGVDACFGDSGGPLYLLTGDGAYLLGITSRGYDDAELPCSEGGIYVRPDAVIAWIEAEIGEELPAPSCSAPADEVVTMGYEVGVCGLPINTGLWATILGSAGLLVRRRRA